VPKSAIRTEGNESYVWTVHDGTVRRVGISIRREPKPESKWVRDWKTGTWSSLRHKWTWATAPRCRLGES